MHRSVKDPYIYILYADTKLNLCYSQAAVPPPKDALRQVHKQAATKRALKMYSVFSDSDDGRSRTPSPLEPIEPQSQLAAVEESIRYLLPYFQAL